ncbi:glycosyltransferase family 39 protein [Myxococcota bacterium]|nr:glycosyltransferase family 39 protein [Myxococcota bacterium]
MTPPLRSLATPLAVGLLLLAGLLLGAQAVPLFDQDEAAYAAFAREMNRSGSWVLHQATWSDMHRKPPLALWSIAASTRVLGERWWAVRLPGAACLAVAVALLWRLGPALFGARRAGLAALVLAGSLFPLFGRTALVDPALLVGSTLASLGLLALPTGPAAWAALAVGVGLAVGLLAKGPAIVLSLGATGLALVVLHPDRRRLGEPRRALALALALVLAPLPLLAWGLRAWQADGGETVRWMLDWYLLRRAGGQVLGQSGPPGLYLLTMLVFLAPWAGLLPAGLAGLLRDLRARRPAAAGLAAWLCGGWLAWELLPSKLPAYALGGYPAVALVIADPLGRLLDGERPGRLVRAGLALQALVLVALAVALAGAGLRLEPEAPLWALVLGGLWTAGAGLAALALLAAGRARVALPLASLVGPVLLLSAWHLVLPRLELRLHPTWAVAREVERMAPPGAPVLLADAWRLPSLPYYLEGQGREVTVLPPEQAAAALSRPGPWVVILPQAPEAGEGLQVGRVDGWIPDKGRPTTFHLVVRDARAEGPRAKPD